MGGFRRSFDKAVATAFALLLFLSPVTARAQAQEGTRSQTAGRGARVPQPAQTPPRYFIPRIVLDIAIEPKEVFEAIQRTGANALDAAAQEKAVQTVAAMSAYSALSAAGNTGALVVYGNKTLAEEIVQDIARQTLPAIVLHADVSKVSNLMAGRVDVFMPGEPFPAKTIPGDPFQIAAALAALKAAAIPAAPNAVSNSANQPAPLPSPQVQARPPIASNVPLRTIEIRAQDIDRLSPPQGISDRIRGIGGGLFGGGNKTGAMSRKEAAESLALQQMTPNLRQSDVVFVFGTLEDLEAVKAGLGNASGVTIVFADTGKAANKELLGSDIVEHAARGVVSIESIWVFRRGEAKPFVKLPMAAAPTLGTAHFANRLIGHVRDEDFGKQFASPTGWRVTKAGLNQILRHSLHTSPAQV